MKGNYAMQKFILRVLIFCLAAFQLWNIVILLNPPVKSEMVRYDTISNFVEGEGLIIRNETVINSDSSGVLESAAVENGVVKKGKMVASVYAGAVDNDTQTKLKQINARIAEIAGAQGSSLVFEGDHTKIENNISARISDIIISINDKNIRHVSELKGDLNVLIGKKNEVSGESGSVATILDELKAEKERYERILSSSRFDLYAPRAGIYSTLIDGFEQVLSGSSMMSMTVEDFENIMKTENELKEGADQPVCKIVDNVEWYVAMLVNNEKASEMKVGQSVYLKLGDNAQEYNATISYISPADGKKCLVGVTATEYSDDAMKGRKTKVTLITDKYTGIKIPIEAVRVHEGVQGVYTITEGLMKFKQADIIYKDDNYAIARENNSGNNSVLLYDEVVVDAKKVGENISIK